MPLGFHTRSDTFSSLVEVKNTLIAPSQHGITPKHNIQLYKDYFCTKFGTVLMFDKILKAYVRNPFECRVGFLAFKF